MSKSQGWGLALLASAVLFWSAPSSANDPFTNDGLASPETLSDSVPERSVVSRGSWSDAVFIAVPEGKGGHGPRISIAASPSIKNGVLGAGWSLGGLESVQRRSPGNGIPSTST